MKKLTLATFVFIAGFLFAQPGQYDFSFPYFNPFNEQNPVRNVYSISKQNDGKLIIIDDDYEVLINDNFLYRVDQNGYLDTTFNVNLIPTWSWYDTPKIEQFSNDKILVTGRFENFNYSGAHEFVRLNNDGSLDSSFYIQDNSFLGVSSGTLITMIQSDDKILVYNEDNNILNRFNYDGTIDSTFQPTGLNFTYIFGFEQLSNDKIVVWYQTDFNNNDNKLVCLNLDGSLDTNFDNSHSISQGVSKSILKIHNNQIYLSSSYMTIDGILTSDIVCFNSDGSLNSTFNSNIANFSTDTEVNCIDFQPNGDLLIGGDFSYINGIAQNKIHRIKSNGLIDNDFSNFAGPIGNNALVCSIVCISDNKSLVGGFFTEYNSFPANGVARIGNFNSSVQIFTTEDNGTCNGDTYISQQVQNPVNYIMVGEDTLQNINSNYANFNDHCAGVYTLNTQNPITGTTINTTPFVIPNSQNFYGLQVPTSGVNIVDTLTFCIENCLIDYATVSQVTIESYTTVGTDSLLIEFAVVDATDTTIVPLYTSIYNYGYNLIQLQLYCLQKSLGSNLVANNVILFDGSNFEVLALEEVEQQSNFVLYPNPTNSEITLEFEGNDGLIELLDLSGKTVFSSKVISGEKLQIQSLKAGIYLVDLNLAGKHTFTKFIKL